MAKIDEFKSFVRKNPRLINHVRSGEMTWQKYFEIYDLYGEDSNAWKDYTEETVATTAAVSSAGFLDFLKNLDLDSVQNGVNSIQRVVGVLQDLSSKDSGPKTSEYKPRPIYKSFDD